MTEPRTKLLKISPDAEAALIEAARDQSRVSGLTHNFYRYPARFSPSFARASIKVFSRPGDLILDPFMGGATSLVEALALGRHAIGVDISSLATFIATVKTTIFSDDELETLETWAKQLPDSINIHARSSHFADYAEDGYYRHLNHPDRWRLRKAIEQALTSAINLNSERLEGFGRCVILRTGQWALDSRKQLPSVSNFRKKLAANTAEMLSGACAFREAVERSGQQPTMSQLNRSAAGFEDEELFKKNTAPRLVLTSPPYPGVHILYHRWQVDGRKEAPAPFWIAGKLDGAGSSYYTMGDRKESGLRSYFENLRNTFLSVGKVCDPFTVIVQVVAFSNPRWQLPQYLKTMEAVGLEEYFLPDWETDDDKRLWREVPNRRWHANQQGETNGSREVVLFHMSSNATQPLLHSPKQAPNPQHLAH